MCEEERRWLLATAFAGRPEVRSIGGTGACPGRPSALPEPQTDPAVAPALGSPGFLQGLSWVSCPVPICPPRAFIPCQLSRCHRPSCSAAPSRGFISDGRNGAEFLPGELCTGVCCMSRMLREGRCWGVCIRSTKLVLRLHNHMALSSCRVPDTWRQA